MCERSEIERAIHLFFDAINTNDASIIPLADDVVNEKLILDIYYVTFALVDSMGEPVPSATVGVKNAANDHPVVDPVGDLS